MFMGNEFFIPSPVFFQNGEEGLKSFLESCDKPVDKYSCNRFAFQLLPE